MTYTDMLYKLLDTITPYLPFSKPIDHESTSVVTIIFEDEPSSNTIFVSPLIISDDELDNDDMNYDACSDQSDDAEVVINLEALWSR